MANKKRRNKKLRRQQVAASAATQGGQALGQAVPDEGVATAETSSSHPAAAPARQAPAYAAGVKGPRKGGQAPTTTTIDIDARVPYFASDLRRIAITGALMVAAIIAASFFIH